MEGKRQFLSSLRKWKRDKSFETGEMGYGPAIDLDLPVRIVILKKRDIVITLIVDDRADLPGTKLLNVHKGAVKGGGGIHRSIFAKEKP